MDCETKIIIKPDGDTKCQTQTDIEAIADDFTSSYTSDFKARLNAIATSLGGVFATDYHGTPLTRHISDSTGQCKACGQYVWKKNMPLGMCSYCVFKLPEFNFELSFKHSPSKNFGKALKLAKSIPSFTEEDRRYYIRFSDVNDFSDNREAVYNLMLNAFQWKSFHTSINGEQIDAHHISVMKHDIDRLLKMNKANSIVFSGDVAVLV